MSKTIYFGERGLIGPTGPRGLRGYVGPEGKGYSGVTSTSTATPASSGSVNLTFNKQGAYVVGQRVRVINTATNYFEGTITAISGSLQSGYVFTIHRDLAVGENSAANWSLAITGNAGEGAASIGDWIFEGDTATVSGNTLQVGKNSSETVTESTPDFTTSATTEQTSQIEIDATGINLERKITQIFNDGVVTNTDAQGAELVAGDGGIYMRYYAEPAGPSNTTYFKVGTDNGAYLEGKQEDVGGYTLGQVKAAMGSVTITTHSTDDKNWLFDQDGHTYFPGVLQVDNGIEGSITGPNGVNIYARNATPLGLVWTLDAQENLFENDPLLNAINNSIQCGVGGVTIEVNPASGGGVWQFAPNKTLRLPPGGDIVDSTGASVLGSSTTDLRSPNGQLTTTLSNLGTLQTTALLPTTFTATVDAAHYSGPGSLSLTGDAWYFSVTFAALSNGTVETQITNNTPWPSNPGYTNGLEFTFTEADHGIPGYTFTLTLVDIQNPSQFMYTTNLTASVPPTLPSTIFTSSPIKLTSGDNSWILGPDGVLTLPNSTTISNDLAGEYSSTFLCLPWGVNDQTSGLFSSNSITRPLSDPLIATVAVGWFVSGPGLTGVKEITQIVEMGDGDRAFIVDLTDGSLWADLSVNIPYRFYTPDYTLVYNGTRLSVDSNEWNFTQAGNLTIPGGINEKVGNDLEIAVHNNRNNDGTPGSALLSLTNNDAVDGSTYTTLDVGAYDIKLNTDYTGVFTGARRTWEFKRDGTLKLPTGGTLGFEGMGWPGFSNGTSQLPVSVMYKDDTGYPQSAITFSGGNNVDGEGSIIIDAYNASTTTGYQWTFSASTGNMTFPNASTIRVDGNNLEVGGMTNFNVEASGVVNVYTATNGETPYQWQFGNDGALTFPGGMNISTEESGDTRLIIDGGSNYIDLRSNGTILIGQNSTGAVQIGNPEGGNFVEIVSEQVKFLLQTVPTSSVGAPGDMQGLIAFDGSYIYYCTQNFGGTTYNVVHMLAEGFDANGVDNGYLVADSYQLPQVGWKVYYNGETRTIDQVNSSNPGFYIVFVDSPLTIPGQAAFAWGPTPATNIWKRVAWSGDTW